MTHVASLLAAIYGVSEAGLLVLKRGARERSEDRGSLRYLWLVILTALAAAWFASMRWPTLRIASDSLAAVAGAIVFVAGFVLRAYAIAYLGRFFTVNVAIAKDHRVIDSGPYRAIRHPSYTGALLIFAGLAISINNALSTLLLIVPVVWVFLHRIRVEEAALSAALGEPYRSYALRTKRLIPGIY